MAGCVRREIGMGGKAFVGLDRILMGHEEVQVVCTGGQVKQSGVLVGRNIAGEICEG